MCAWSLTPGNDSASSATLLLIFSWAKAIRMTFQGKGLCLLLLVAFPYQLLRVFMGYNVTVGFVPLVWQNYGTHIFCDADIRSCYFCAPELYGALLLPMALTGKTHKLLHTVFHWRPGMTAILVLDGFAWDPAVLRRKCLSICRTRSQGLGHLLKGGAMGLKEI